MPEAQGPQTQGLRAYTSGKSQVHMSQVICNTSGTLKICSNLVSMFWPLYIVTGTRCCCGLYFIVVMMFLHGSAGDCGFTTTFYKAAGLING